MNNTAMKTLTATLPNGKVVTRTTKANYAFVAIALNPFSGEYEVQGWSTKPNARSFAYVTDRSLLVREGGAITAESHKAMMDSQRKVETQIIAVDA